MLLPQPTGLSARSRLLGADAPLDTSGEVRGTDYYSSGVMDLRTRGSLSDAPVLDVPGDSPQLWRGAILSTYDGQGWYARPETLGFLDQAPTYVIPHPFDTLPATQGRTDTVRLLSHFTGTIVTPGVPQEITVAGGINVSVDGSLGLVLGPGAAALRTRSRPAPRSSTRRCSRPPPAPSRRTTAGCSCPQTLPAARA